MSFVQRFLDCFKKVADDEEPVNKTVERYMLEAEERKELENLRYEAKLSQSIRERIDWIESMKTGATLYVHKTSYNKEYSLRYMIWLEDGQIVVKDAYFTVPNQYDAIELTYENGKPISFLLSIIMEDKYELGVAFPDTPREMFDAITDKRNLMVTIGKHALWCEDEKYYVKDRAKQVVTEIEPHQLMGHLLMVQFGIHKPVWSLREEDLHEEKEAEKSETR